MVGLGESTVTQLTQHIQTQKLVFGRLPLFFSMTLNITQYLVPTDDFLHSSQYWGWDTQETNKSAHYKGQKKTREGSFLNTSTIMITSPSWGSY